MRFTSELLPTLGLPMTATRIAVVVGLILALGREIRHALRRAGRPCRGRARRKTEMGFAEAEGVELIEGRVHVAGGVHLVDNEYEPACRSA